MKPVYKKFLLSTMLIWFTIAGILLTFLAEWVFNLSLTQYQVLKAGSLMGIVTGGVAILFSYISILNKANQVQ